MSNPLELQSELPLSPQQQQQLQAYVHLLLQDGDRLGLTAFREAEPIWEELIWDSASAAAKLPAQAEVVDLGSGGGCPGVVLQILRPDTRIFLLESNGRKAGFLQRVVSQLELPSQVLQQRSEIIAHQADYRQRFRMVVAKAVAGLPTLIELALPLLQVGGQLLAFKGPQAQQEIEQAGSALNALKGGRVSLEPYRMGEKSYCHVLVEKLGPTPNDYPRRPGLPAKQPLR